MDIKKRKIEDINNNEYIKDIIIEISLQIPQKNLFIVTNFQIMNFSILVNNQNCKNDDYGFFLGKTDIYTLINSNIIDISYKLHEINNNYYFFTLFIETNIGIFEIIGYSKYKNILFNINYNDIQREVFI